MKMIWLVLGLLIIAAAGVDQCKAQKQQGGAGRAPQFRAAGRSGGGAGGAASGTTNNYNHKLPAEGLVVDFYKESCPNAERIIEEKVAGFLHREPGQAAGILRIMFHDCFVQGCDASILLVKPITEQTATPNNASLRITSLRALDEIKLALEEACPGTVSCADTIALSTAAAVRMSGGPSIKFATGRRDSLNAASNQTVTNNIPAPTLSISALKQNFQNHGLDNKDLVALSGGHTIGEAHCRIVNQQLTPTISSDLNPKFASNLARICRPQQSNNPNVQRQTVHLDFITMNQFDNAYFHNVLAKTATFHSDAELLKAPDTQQLVQDFAKNQDHFFEQFVASMIKMSQIGVLTGEQGTIRKKCTLPN